jgi:hypothetical protein
MNGSSAKSSPRVRANPLPISRKAYGPCGSSFGPVLVWISVIRVSRSCRPWRKSSGKSKGNRSSMQWLARRQQPCQVHTVYDKGVTG